MGVCPLVSADCWLDHLVIMLLWLCLVSQVARCPYHNAVEGSLSLLTDYEAGPECLPTQAHQVRCMHAPQGRCIHVYAYIQQDV